MKRLDKIFFQIELDFKRREKFYLSKGDLDLVNRNRDHYRKAIKDLSELLSR